MGDLEKKIAAAAKVQAAREEARKDRQAQLARQMQQPVAQQPDLVPTQVPQQPVTQQPNLAPTQAPQQPHAKGKSSQGRTVQICVRYTPKERTQLQRKVEMSGMAQGDYIRVMSLQGTITVQQTTDYPDVVYANLSTIRYHMHQLGGLLTMIRDAAQRYNPPIDRIDQWIASTAPHLRELSHCIHDLQEQISHDS